MMYVTEAVGWESSEESKGHSGQRLLQGGSSDASQATSKWQDVGQLEKEGVWMTNSLKATRCVSEGSNPVKISDED